MIVGVIRVISGVVILRRVYRWKRRPRKGQ
jgi:hypothetical protein